LLEIFKSYKSARLSIMVVVGFGRSYIKTKESSCCVKCWFNSETANEQQHL